MSLESEVKRAYFPYMRAFLDDPDIARMEVLDDGVLVEGVVRTSVPDLNSIMADPGFRSEMSRTFNRLVRYLAPNRAPLLRFDKVGS